MTAALLEPTPQEILSVERNAEMQCERGRLRRL
jgi:hypothetical protein